jgi:TPR repeat protein
VAELLLVRPMRPLIIAIVLLRSTVGSFAAEEPTKDADLVRLADAYAEAKGVRQDYKKAAALYEKAAGLKYAAAECKLGKLYCEGKGVPLNFTQGKQWLRRAAAHGSKEAKYALEDLKTLERASGISLQ